MKKIWIIAVIITLLLLWIFTLEDPQYKRPETKEENWTEINVLDEGATCNNLNFDCPEGWIHFQENNECGCAR